jgi:hypothetical protein
LIRQETMGEQKLALFLGKIPHIPHALALLQSTASKHGQFKWAVFWWETARLFW